MCQTQALARSIRRSALHMVHRARASHIASALSIADIVAVLYGQVMNHRPAEPRWPERDRFILSKGHACSAVYAALAHVGYLELQRLEHFGLDHSELMNHISHHVPGVEFSTGSLGHGLPFGVGKALAAQMRGQPWRTFVLLSDGEMAEGANWEALLFAAHHRLEQLCALIDYNQLQSLGSVAETLALEPLADKLLAFGCEVLQVDGHAHDQIAAALNRPSLGQPRVVIAHTVKGKGVSFMQNRVEWHYKNPDDAQLAQALAELEADCA